MEKVFKTWYSKYVGQKETVGGRIPICAYEACRGCKKFLNPTSRRNGTFSRMGGSFYPFTDPAVTPLMMKRERTM